MEIGTKLRLATFSFILIGLLVYFSSLTNSFILGDDTDQIVENPQIRSLSNIPAFFGGSTYYRTESGRAYGLYYKPVMMVSYTLIYQLFGADPLPYHLVQLILYIANGILLFYLCRRFFSFGISWLIAAIFVVHPANSEVVLWAATLQDVLYVFFGLLALIFVTKSNQDLTKPRNLFILGGLLLLSVFSKETGIVFIILCSLYTLLNKPIQFKRTLFVYPVVFIIYVFFRFGIAHIGFGEQAITRISRATEAVRLMNIPELLVKYGSLMLFPLHLEVHQNWLIENFSFQNVGIPLLIIALVACLFILFAKYIWNNKKQLRLPFVFFSLWLLLGLLPHLQLIPLDETFAERWAILPLIGLLGLLGVGLTAYQKFFQGKVWLVTAGLIIVLLAGRSLIRTFDWHSSETLFAHDLRGTQNNYYLENLYASELIKQGKPTEAEVYVEQSLAGYRFLSNLSNMAIIKMKQGDYVAADQYFSQSLQKNHVYPAVQNYANFLVFVAENNQKAKEIAQQYLPEYPQAGYLWMVLAVADFRLGNKNEAISSAQKSIKYTNAPIVQKVYTDIIQYKNPEVKEFLQY